MGVAVREPVARAHAAKELTRWEMGVKRRAVLDVVVGRAGVGSGRIERSSS